MFESILQALGTICFLGISLLCFRFARAPRGDGGYLKRSVTLFYVGLFLFVLVLTRVLGLVQWISIEQQRTANAFISIPIFWLIIFEAYVKNGKHTEDKPKVLQ